jgi:hypothetical protein
MSSSVKGLVGGRPGCVQSKTCWGLDKTSFLESFLGDKVSNESMTASVKGVRGLWVYMVELNEGW